MKVNRNQERLYDEYNRNLSLLKNSTLIILYGKTQMTSLIRQIIEELEVVCNILTYDKNSKDSSCIHDIGDIRATCIIICGLSKKTRDSMLEDIKQIAGDSSQERCIDFFSLYYVWSINHRKRGCDPEEFAQTIIRSKDEDNIILNIDCINTSYCNLKCKECSNGMQIREDRKFLSPKNVVSDVKKITALYPIEYVNIQGGEPLIDNNLPEIIYGLAKNPRIAFLTLATNGSVIPQNDEVFEALSNTGVIIRISDYGGISNKKDELKRIAVKNGIPCDTYERASSWVVYGHYEKHNRSIESNKDISYKCFFGRKDLMMYDGYLYCCCRSLFGNALGSEDEAIRLNRVDLNVVTKSKLMDIVEGVNLHLMCDYCDWPMKSVIPAEQL